MSGSPFRRAVEVAESGLLAIGARKPAQKMIERSILHRHQHYVLERLRDMSQKRFDGAVVDALARSHAKGGLIPTEAAPAARAQAAR